MPPSAPGVTVGVNLYAVLAAAVFGLACGPVGIRQRRIGRAPHPRALRRSIGAANPHSIASRSGDQRRVLRCGLNGRQLQARRQAGGVGIVPREGVAHQRVDGRRRLRDLELEELHREPPAEGGVPVVFAGRGGRPFGGGPVVGERVRAAVVPVAVAVRGDLRPRAVRIARVDLDVPREACGAIARVTSLPIPAAPDVVVVKREDEVDVVGAVHAVAFVRVEWEGTFRRVARIRQFERASAITAHLLLPASDAGVVVLAVDAVLRGPLPVHGWLRKPELPRLTRRLGHLRKIATGSKPRRDSEPPKDTPNWAARDLQAASVVGWTDIAGGLGEGGGGSGLGDGGGGDGDGGGGLGDGGGGD
eukprot:scaffold85556_cov56-Phaeocystis_antarctica.AAC.2